MVTLSILRHTFYALRIHIVELHAPGYYCIRPLVLLPVAKDSEAEVCASLFSYLTSPKRVRLAREHEILRASLACQRCSGLGILLLLKPCELLRFPVGMLDQGHWCADMAVQRWREFNLYIFEMLRYHSNSLQQVVFGFHHKFLTKLVHYHHQICLFLSHSNQQNALHVSSRHGFFHWQTSN